MVKIAGSGDCGNSPKNKFAQDVLVALLTGDASFLETALSGDTVWTRADGGAVTGRDAIIAASGQDSLESLTVLHALSHGRTGAANARVVPVTGEAYGICCVIEFASIKGDRAAHVASYRAGG